jgi:hypothetical protein
MFSSQGARASAFHVKASVTLFSLGSLVRISQISVASGSRFARRKPIKHSEVREHLNRTEMLIVIGSQSSTIRSDFTRFCLRKVRSVFSIPEEILINLIDSQAFRSIKKQRKRLSHVVCRWASDSAFSVANRKIKTFFVLYNNDPDFDFRAFMQIPVREGIAFLSGLLDFLKGCSKA